MAEQKENNEVNQSVEPGTSPPQERKPSRISQFFVAISERPFLAVMTVVLLIVIGIFYRKDVYLEDNLVYAFERIEELEKQLENSNDLSGYTRVAVIAFEPTIKSWQKYDPTGQQIRVLLDRTIRAYNEAGYVIIDSDSVVGGLGGAKFINLSPSEFLDEDGNMKAN